MIHNSEVNLRIDHRVFDTPHSLSAALQRLSQRMLETVDNLADPAGVAHTNHLIRIDIRLHPLDPLVWLQSLPHGEKLYFEDREGTYAIAGVGAADRILADDPAALPDRLTSIQHRLSGAPEQVRYYGGLRFNGLRPEDSSWLPFGYFRFVLPMLELWRRGNEYYLSCNLLPRATHISALKDLLSIAAARALSTPPRPSSEPRLLSRYDLPSRGQWSRQIDVLLQAFERGEMDKVVLARKSTFVFSDDLDGPGLLRRLRASNPQLFYFYFQPQPGHAFLGGSPERLYRREGFHIKSEAIAGTRPRGLTLDEDERLARALLESEKDRREHRFVLDTILQTLQGFCHTVDHDAISLLKLARVQHLCCRLQGVLRDHVRDADLLQALHPTPAVGGSPTPRALQAIRELEPFDRGWYAGPVGWIGPNGAEFVVGIRSGLIQGNRLSLFSGAGIVKGSTAESEWQEIENKIANFMKIFHSS